jgi:hypothetical protein
MVADFAEHRTLSQSFSLRSTLGILALNLTKHSNRCGIVALYFYKIVHFIDCPYDGFSPSGDLQS